MVICHLWGRPGLRMLHTHQTFLPLSSSSDTVGSGWFLSNFCGLRESLLLHEHRCLHVLNQTATVCR